MTARAAAEKRATLEAELSRLATASATAEREAGDAAAAAAPLEAQRERSMR